MSESIENLKKKFLKWKEAFESEGFEDESQENQSNGERFEK